ncbi:MAG: ATP-dependent DNA helicase RecG [Anaerolineae bacterium]|nr:ATP-dependent DNA helicase RecG [Anaerolineae bacterium]
MPSALETLVKILKLEREQGCKNSAVIGGLAAFSEKWSQDAHTQARKPEHHLLVDELGVLLRRYETIESKTERHTSITYMIDRITGRVPPPPEYRAPAVERDSAPNAESPPPKTPPTPRPPAQRPPRERPGRQERGERRDQPASPDRSERREQAPPDQGESQERPGRPDRSERDERQERPGRPERPERRRETENKPQRPPPQASKQPQRSDDDDDDGDEVMPADMRRVDRVGSEATYDNFDIPMRGRYGNRGRSAQLDIPQPIRLARPPRRPRPAMSAEQAEDILRGLKAPVTTIKGIGPSVASLLEKLGVYTVNDMLFLLPRRYDDYTHMRTISHLVPDAERPATVIGTVMHAEVRVGRSGRKDFFMVIDDASARMAVTFFGQHWLIRQIKKGQQLVLSGIVSMWNNQPQMINPEWEQLDVENLHTIGIVPVYPLTEGLSGKTLRKLMRSTVTYWAERLPDYVPESTLERSELADLGWAIKNLHFPESWDHLQHAKNRLMFDELLLLQLAVLANRREWQAVPGPALNAPPEMVEQIIQAVFPYPLTNAQRRVIDDIRRDVSTTTPMNRLIQGDVGSGKTAVATVAIGMALANEKQAALMVPTSILAEQHYRNIGATLEMMPSGRKPVVALLTGSLTTTERASIYSGMADGSIDVVIGTHALIQEGVEFKDLAVAIIDEQHRFGVEQRKALRGKGMNPHLLVMTATPIPRTLALTIFADLDLSVIDEMPPGRIPIQTRVVQPVERERVYNFIESQLQQGRQAFVVHPLVEASEKIEAPAAVEAYERLQQVFFRHKVGLLHGRMKPAEKDEIMAAFGAAQYDVLVTTSVAEVGVNVPNATVMVIEGANRFGLAQLHQFRGRVGRGEHASYCLLLSDTNSEEAMQRLQAMEDTNDGFKLAELDWRLRGAGDLVGTRQSGGSVLQLAHEVTPQLVDLAQREARTIYEEDIDLSHEQHRLLAQRVQMLHNERTDVS